MISADPYVAFTRRFFGRWSPLYDLFAKPIGFAYGAAVREAGARPGRTILDLCTGTGEIAIRCGRRGARVTAVDLTPSMFTRAMRKARGLPVRFTGMDARRLAFRDASFDAVLLSFALHDMPRRVRTEVLREAARAAREAVVVLDYDVPRQGPGRRLVRRLVLGGLGLFETPYLADFAKQGARGAIEEAGLTISKTVRPLPGLFVVHVVDSPGIRA
jgi:demethylmenaquinone methyltransferase/2-methoxy-6-polyprenyl-1,4-benzoquinol methylase